MKRIITLLFVGFITLSINAQQNKQEKTVDPNAPVFEFVTDIIDYGKIEQNANGVRVFEFKNVGKSPLVISKVNSSCGCTVPKYSKEPILPGQTGKIEAKYATNRLGGFNKTLTIMSNASEPTKRIRIKGIVLKPESVVVKQKSTVSSK